MKQLSIIVLVFIVTPLVHLHASNNSLINNNINIATAILKISDTSTIKIPNSYVCMINNKLMHAAQIAVPVNDKIYYGCCQGCVKKLTEDASSRFAIDPLSGEKVDKADAFITLLPGSKQDVLYFKTEINAKNYLAKSAQEKNKIN